MNNQKKKEVGNRIKSIRQDKGLTMKDFGKKIDSKVTKGTVNNWEKGRACPRKDRLKKIAELENISVDELLHGKDQLFLELTTDERKLLDEFANKQSLSIKEAILRNTIYKNEEINKKEVGNRIKNIRYSHGDSQTEFANKINATLPAVSNWENGRNIPNNERLKNIAEIGDLTVAELLYGKKERNKKNEIGNRIKSIRYKKSLNKTEFGKLLGATGSLVSKWENHNVRPSEKRFKKIADIGDISVDELLYGKDQLSSEKELINEINELKEKNEQMEKDKKKIKQYKKKMEKIEKKNKEITQILNTTHDNSF